jgi:HAD superfamily hydrolase (TIGR01509 family)
MNEKRLGAVVQRARQAAGMTQQTLCQKSGISYSTLAKIERGAIKAPSIFTIQTIATTLGITLDQLMESVPPQYPASAKQISRNGVRFVFFDMNGCLIRFYNRAFTALAQEAGVTTDVVESIFWRYNDDVCRGAVSIDELNTALAERLNMMVDWRRYYLEAVEATPGVRELVHWVAENYKVGILTNTMPNIVQPLIDQRVLPDVKYDAIIDSSEVGAIKPEAHIFEVAMERTGVSANEILLIDDDRPNLVAAGKLGWHTMSFDALHPEDAIVGISTALQPS